MASSKGRELAKNTAIISIGKMCTQLVSFLLMPLYTAVLTTEEYGIVDLVVTYGQLLLPIVTMQMEQALFRFLIDYRKDEIKKKETISNIVSLTFYITLMFTGIYFLISFFIHSEYKFYLLVNLWGSVICSMMLQMSRGLGLNMVYALGSFISAAGQVGLNVVFVFAFKWGASGMILAMIISHLLCAIFVAYKIHFTSYFRITKISVKKAKEYLSYSAPLVPNAISWWILSASDRTIILRFLGVGFNGVYSAATKFSGIYTTLYNIFNLSWTESVSLYLKDRDSSEVFTKLQNKVISLCISATLGLISIMPFVFKLLVNEKFGDSYYQIPLLVIGAYFSSMVGLVSAYYIADKKTSVIAKTTVSCAVINILLNLAMISKIGLYAASISTVVAYAALYVLRCIDVKKRFNISLNHKLIFSGLIMMVLALAVYYYKNLIYCGIYFILYLVYAVCINKELLIDILKLIKEKIKHA